MGPLVKIEGYVPDWPGAKQHGKATANILRRFCPVTILDNPDHYFTQQWERARGLFDATDADILLWVMADVWPPINIDEMLPEIERLMAGPVGVYAPQVRWTCWQFPLDSIKNFEPDIYEVPCGDMLCWAVRRDVLTATPHCDPSINWVGTGIDWSVSTAARQMGVKNVKDYRFTATHPLHTAYWSPEYPPDKAWADMQRWIDTLYPSFQSAMRNIIQESVDKVVRDDDILAQYKPTNAEIERMATWSLVKSDG